MKLPRRNFLYLAAGATALSALNHGCAWSIARPVAFGTPWSAIHRGKPVGRGYGAAEAIRSRPDGYTLFLLGISHATTPSWYDKLPYNIVHDTSPIALLYQANYVMVVNPSLPVTSVAEFIAYANANPGKVNMGSAGAGSIGHLAGELFKSMTGIQMIHVPYRSVALALADVVSGQMHVQFATSTDSIPQIRGGQVRALAVSSATRLPALPDVPTVAEYLPDYAFDSWVGMAGPKNIAAEIVEVLNREINASLARPEIKAKYDDLGLRINAGSPADFRKLIAEETEKWGKVIRAANIKAE
jgi:tripartite-type tricarboxylate transporter receptor subunit TctC